MTLNSKQREKQIVTIGGHTDIENIYIFCLQSHCNLTLNQNVNMLKAK